MKYITNNFKILKDVYHEVDHTVNDSISTFYKKLKQPNLNPFHQSRLIGNSIFWNKVNEDYPSLEFGGVCNGLSVDYARHVISHRNMGTEANYISKLNRKFNLSGKSPKKFLDRINSYQIGLQGYGNIHAGRKKVDIKNIDNSKFIDSLPSIYKESTIIGLSFQEETSGHIIAIQFVKNDNQETIGYKIFDANLGEFDCAYNEDIAKNTKIFNEELIKIRDFYSKMEMNEIEVSDLEKIVTNLGLVKERRSTKEFSSEDKYLQNKVKMRIDNKINYFTKLDNSSENVQSLKSYVANANTDKILELIIRGVDYNKLRNEKGELPKFPSNFSRELTREIVNARFIDKDETKYEMLVNLSQDIGNIKVPYFWYAGKLKKILNQHMENKSYKEVIDVLIINNDKLYAEVAHIKDIIPYVKEAIDSNNMQVLEGLSKLQPDIITKSIEGKSLLQYAIDQDKNYLSVKMIHKGFKLKDEELSSKYGYKERGKLSKAELIEIMNLSQPNNTYLNHEAYKMRKEELEKNNIDIAQIDPSERKQIHQLNKDLIMQEDESKKDATYANIKRAIIKIKHRTVMLPVLRNIAKNMSEKDVPQSPTQISDLKRRRKVRSQ